MSINIFDPKFIKSAEKLVKHSEHHFNLSTKDGHEIKYIMYLSNFTPVLDVHIDNTAYMYNNPVERAHKDAFNYMSRTVWGNDNKATDKAESKVRNWLNS